MINKKWYDLATEINMLNIKIPDGATRQDLINILAAAKSTGAVLMQVPCQLAKDFRNLSPRRQKEVLQSDGYIAEEKFDGCRAKLHFLEEKNRIDTRNQSVQTYCYNERTENFPHLTRPIKALVGTIIDGEMQMPCETLQNGKTQTVDGLTTTAAVFNSQPVRAIQLQNQYGLMNYVMFDILFYNGADVREHPWYERRRMLKHLQITLWASKEAIASRDTLKTIKLSHVYKDDLESCFMNFVTTGKEGIMLKSKYAPYSMKEGSRPGRVWYKWKKESTIEAFITGYVSGQGKYEGLIGALTVSVYDKNKQLHEIASVAPGNDAARSNLTDCSELADWAYMQVVEISFQQRTKNGRLRHPVLVKFRPEMHYLACIDPYFD